MICDELGDFVISRHDDSCMCASDPDPTLSCFDSAGATVTRHVKAEHPAARILAELAATQASVAADGSITAVLYAAALVHEAVLLLSGRLRGKPPRVVTQVYHEAYLEARRAIEARAVPCTTQLRAVARACLATRVATRAALDEFSQVCLPPPRPRPQDPAPTRRSLLRSPLRGPLHLAIPASSPFSAGELQCNSSPA